MSDANRTAVAVTLLFEDADARRLTLSWPLVEPHLRDTSLLVTWARVSGVPLSRVKRLSEVLLRHGLCREGRSIDPEALRVCQHFAAEQLRAGAAQRGRR